MNTTLSTMWRNDRGPFRSLAIFLAVLLSGCGPGSESGDASPENGSEEFAAYLEIRGLDGLDAQAREREWKAYRERAALADAMLETGKVDRRLIDAETRNYRNQLIINRYFEPLLKNAMSEANLRRYFDEHAEDFGRPWVKIGSFQLLGITDADRDKILEQLHAGTPADSIAVEIDGFVVLADGTERTYVDALKPALAEKVRNAKGGDVFGPLQGNGAIMLYKVETGPTVDEVKFEDVEKQVAFIVRNKIRQQEIRRLLSGRNGIDQ